MKRYYPTRYHPPLKHRSKGVYGELPPQTCDKPGDKLWDKEYPRAHPPVSLESDIDDEPAF